MMKTSVGPMEDSASVAYLRPETAQGIFVNFKNIYQSARKRPPFGIAQIGKSFRNEITPGNFTFRVREFEQAELEYFVPDDGNDVAVLRSSGSRRARSGTADYGVRAERLRFYELTPQERPHYAKAGTDVEYLFPWGWGELESIAHRGTYDLDAHMKLSGKDLTYFDEATKQQVHADPDRELGRHGPHDAHDAGRRLRERDDRRSESGKETKRVVLRFHPKIAPVQVGVFPLARNKPELVERAQRSSAALRPFFRTQYDEGNVGQLYRRQDEIGTPACIMVDYQTLSRWYRHDPRSRLDAARAHRGGTGRQLSCGADLKTDNGAADAGAVAHAHEGCVGFAQRKPVADCRAQLSACDEIDDHTQVAAG